MVNVLPYVNPVRKNPDDKAEILNDESDLTVLEFKGDWAKVTNNECVGNSTFEEGWVRWRKGDHLMINITYIC